MLLAGCHSSIFPICHCIGPDKNWTGQEERDKLIWMDITLVGGECCQLHTWGSFIAQGAMTNSWFERWRWSENITWQVCWVSSLFWEVFGGVARNMEFFDGHKIDLAQTDLYLLLMFFLVKIYSRDSNYQIIGLFTFKRCHMIILIIIIWPMMTARCRQDITDSLQKGIWEHRHWEIWKKLYGKKLHWKLYLRTVASTLLWTHRKEL